MHDDDPCLWFDPDRFASEEEVRAFLRTLIYPPDPDPDPPPPPAHRPAWLRVIEGGKRD